MYRFVRVVLAIVLLVASGTVGSPALATAPGSDPVKRPLSVLSQLLERASGPLLALFGPSGGGAQHDPDGLQNGGGPQGDPNGAEQDGGPQIDPDG